MLKLRRALAISRADCPAIRFHASFRSSNINHWLDRKHHPRTKLERRAFLREMKHVRLFVERTPNAVPRVFSHRGKALFLTILLDGRADVTKSFAGQCLLYTNLCAALRHIY